MRMDRIILADDHPVFREGLRRLLQRTASETEIIEAGSFKEMLSLARRCGPPNTFILDLMFGDRSIEPDLPGLRQEFGCASIIVLSAIDERAIAERILNKGADAFICKALPPNEIAAGIAAVIEGEQVLLLQSASPETSPFENETARLTQRQLDVLRLLIAGKTNKEIAQALEISPFTVRIHVSALLKSLGVSSRTAAVAKASAYGLI